VSHPKRRRATYSAVSYSVAPFWFGLSCSTGLLIVIIGMFIQKGLSL
jgi:hypothetical protein